MLTSARCFLISTRGCLGHRAEIGRSSCRGRTPVGERTTTRGAMEAAPTCGCRCVGTSPIEGLLVSELVRVRGAGVAGRCRGAAEAAVGGPCRPVSVAGACLASDWSVEGRVQARGRPAVEGLVGGRAGHHSWSLLCAIGPRVQATTGACVASACLSEHRRLRRRGSLGTDDASVGPNTGCRLLRRSAPHTAATATASRWRSGWSRRWAVVASLWSPRPWIWVLSRRQKCWFLRPPYHARTPFQKPGRIPVQTLLIVTCAE